jgi:hypothetical protein
MTKKYLLTLAIATILLGGCTKTKPVTLSGQDFYLVSSDMLKSKYLEINYQFKEKEVEVKVCALWLAM